MFLYVNVVAEQCSDGVCLTWKVSEEQLTLICKVGQILHRVKIVNPSGCLQGDCLPPIPATKCDSYHKNDTITLNTTTNEIIYTLRGHIDDKVNGKWTCKHGEGTGNADVDVTVLTIKGKVFVRKCQ